MEEVEIGIRSRFEKTKILEARIKASCARSKERDAGHKELWVAGKLGIHDQEQQSPEVIGQKLLLSDHHLST